MKHKNNNNVNKRSVIKLTNTVAYKCNKIFAKQKI